MKLPTFTVGMKIHVISVLAVLGFTAIIGLAVLKTHSMAFADREEELKALSQTAMSIAEHFHMQETAGTMSRVEAQTAAISAIKTVRYNEADYFWINDMEPRMVMHPTKPELDGKPLGDVKDPDGKRLFQAFVEKVKAEGGGIVDYQWPKPGSDKPQPKLSYVVGFAPWGWIVGTGLYVDDLNAEVLSESIDYVIVAGIILSIMGGIGFFLARSLTVPLRRLRQPLLALASGDESAVIEVSKRKDEIGDMERAVDVLRERVVAAYQQAQMLEEMETNVMMADPRNDFRLSYVNRSARETFETLRDILKFEGDLVGTSIDIFHRHPDHARRILSSPDNLPWKSKVKVGTESFTLRIAAIRDRNGHYIGPMMTWSQDTEIIKLADDFEATVKSVADALAQTSGELEQSSTSLGRTADTTSTEADVVALASQDASGNVETVAAAAEQLLASIQEISRQVSEAAQVTGVAEGQARGTEMAVTRLDHAAQTIGEIVGLIESIASQTNLLALNATIEAARAGEAGKGFAVVASEVKGLANQTAKATQDIQTQIAAVQQETRTTVDAIRQIVETVGKVNGITATIAAAVEEQGAATQEISRSVQQAATGTRKVSSSIGALVDSAAETNRSAEGVRQAATTVDQQTRRLNGHVDSFIVAVRAL
ncbi:methyl-accepting chemotaxis protein [Constrictibacter sp. MBR-5]|jgi:methyl-accepting chemotaxis protein|uniref:cache domain-containing protein n=1 Tax=Constrictibacter sp. MBR-5 TaxID=3156467 RepID=UPI003394FAB5